RERQGRDLDEDSPPARARNEPAPHPRDDRTHVAEQRLPAVPPGAAARAADPAVDPDAAAEAATHLPLERRVAAVVEPAVAEIASEPRLLVAEQHGRTEPPRLERRCRGAALQRAVVPDAAADARDHLP